MRKNICLQLFPFAKCMSFISSAAYKKKLKHIVIVMSFINSKKIILAARNLKNMMLYTINVIS